MESYQFERDFVAVVVEIIESRGLKHDAVAKDAWSGRRAAGRTWQFMRNNNPPQRLTMRDAHALAKYLGVSMAGLCGIVEGRAIQDSMKYHKRSIPEV